MSGEFNERRITKANAAKYHRRAKISAGRKGFNQDADDIAQGVILAMLEGRHQHATIDQAVIDAIRKRYGRPDTAQFAARTALRTALPIGKRNSDKLGSVNDGKRLDDRLDIERMVRALKGDERALFVLIYKWGFTYPEAGECFGVSQSRICQRLKIIHAKLVAKIFPNASSTRNGADKAP